MVRPALLWLDYSGDRKLRDFVRGHPDLDVVAITAMCLSPTSRSPSGWSLDADPTLADRLRWLLGAKDFVRAKMCGLDGVTDWNDAGGTQFFDTVNRVWSLALCEAAGLPRHVLPRVCDSTAMVGAARSATGDVLALRAVVGTGDQAAASRAVGGTTPGTASLGLGTSGVMARSFEAGGLGGRLDPRFHLFPLDPPGTLHVIGTVPSIGPTLAWLSRLLGKRKGALSAPRGRRPGGHTGRDVLPLPGRPGCAACGCPTGGSIYWSTGEHDFGRTGIGRLQRHGPRTGVGPEGDGRLLRKRRHSPRLLGRGGEGCAVVGDDRRRSRRAVPIAGPSTARLAPRSWVTTLWGRGSLHPFPRWTCSRRRCRWPSRPGWKAGRG